LAGKPPKSTDTFRWLRLWEYRGDDRLRDNLWRAACWEYSAQERKDKSQQKMDLLRAQAIMEGEKIALLPDWDFAKGDWTT
jgi:hypothetical protein